MIEGKKILCVEDEAEMIDPIKLILRRKGHTVVGALGGAEALEMVNEERPDPILLDPMIPDVDGWEAFRRLEAKENFKDIPVVVVTAKSQDIHKAIGLYIAEVDKHFVKPFGPQQPIGSMELVLSRTPEWRHSERPSAQG